MKSAEERFKAHARMITKEYIKYANPLKERTMGNIEFGKPLKDRGGLVKEIVNNLQFIEKDKALVITDANAYTVRKAVYGSKNGKRYSVLAGKDGKIYVQLR